MTCVYHNWTYDLQGNLKSVAFQRGVKGKGGMPPGFDVGAHGPRKLRLTSLCGLVFGSCDPAVPAIEDYLGPEILTSIRRVLHKPIVVTLQGEDLFVEGLTEPYKSETLALMRQQVAEVDLFVSVSE